MRIEVIELGAMRPDPNNPREDFGDIAELAATFAFNAENPGEPLNPPIVVKDGNVYRIVDGERRYRAMRELQEIGEHPGTCHAIVCEGMDEADAAVMMLATDDKESLSRNERAKGAQRMLMLGVDEDTVDEVAKLAPGTARRARGAIELLGKRADQLSLDQIIAAGEAREAGDDELAEAIAAAEDEWGAGGWRSLADERRRARVKAAQDVVVERVCERRGMELKRSRPKGCVVLDTIHVGERTDPKDIEEGLGKVRGAEVVVFANLRVDRPYDWPDIEVCAPAPDLTEEEAEALSSKNRAKSDMTKAKRRRAEFVGERLGDLRGIEQTLAWFAEEFPMNEYEVSNFAKKAGVEADAIPRVPDPWLMAMKWPYADGMTQDGLMAILFGEGTYPATGEARKFMGLLMALEKDGYEADEHEKALFKACRRLSRKASK